MTEDLYTEITKSELMPVTFDRESLISEYCQTVIDGMDMNTLLAYAYDMMVQSFESYSDNELITEVEEYYPELLEG